MMQISVSCGREPSLPSVGVGCTSDEVNQNDLVELGTGRGTCCWGGGWLIASSCASRMFKGIGRLIIVRLERTLANYGPLVSPYKRYTAESYIGD